MKACKHIRTYYVRHSPLCSIRKLKNPVNWTSLKLPIEDIKDRDCVKNKMKFSFPSSLLLVLGTTSAFVQNVNRPSSTCFSKSALFATENGEDRRTFVNQVSF